jgi:hypothetical protein
MQLPCQLFAALSARNVVANRENFFALQPRLPGWGAKNFSHRVGKCAVSVAVAAGMRRATREAMINDLIKVGQEQLDAIGPARGQAGKRLQAEIACLQLLSDMLDTRPSKVLATLKLAKVLLRAPAPGEVVTAARVWEGWRMQRCDELGPLHDVEADLAGAVRDLPAEGEL